MNWFKHYANADKDSRLQRLKTDYGYSIADIVCFF